MLLFHEMVFQDTHFKWINNKPFVYYPWQPNFVSQSVQYQLITDTPLQLQKVNNFLKKSKFKEYNHF